MSVINKMLRDLDSRQSVAAATELVPGASRAHGDAHSAALEATSAVRQRMVRRGLVAMSTALTLTGALSWWYLDSVKPVRQPTTVATAAPPVALIAGVAPAASESSPPVTAPPTLAEQPVVKAMAPAPEPVPVLEPVPVPVPVPVPLAAPTPVAVMKPAPKPAAKVEPAPAVTRGAPVAAVGNPPAAAPVPQVAKAPESSGPTPEVPANAPLVPAKVTRTAPRAASSQEVMAQAGALWAQGHREAAMGLLTDALSIAENAGAGKPVAVQLPVLLPVARELARMKMALGQVEPALRMLTALEPQLAGVGDIWATRANAAQRLGRHAESVQAYQSALSLQADEPRWQQGLAVSLAAQGRLDEAATWAEKARLAGGLRPEVAQYLRQLGVSLP